MNLVTEEEDTTCNQQAATRAEMVTQMQTILTDTLCNDWVVSPQPVLETHPIKEPQSVKHVKDDISTPNTSSVVKAALPTKITKPASKQAEKPKVQKKQAAQATLHIYIVEKGDTFYSISRKLKIDVKRLREFNPGMYKVLTPGYEIRYWKTDQ